MIDEGCEHIEALKEYLKENQLDVFSEWGEEPEGWVNVNCPKCHVTYEVSLRIWDNE